MSKSVYVNILLVMLLALTAACKKEGNIPEPAPEMKTVHYKATVQTGADTRATIGGDMKYEYEDGDRVYMESVDGEGNADGNLYGFLSLAVKGSPGRSTALFEGDLKCLESFTPTSETPVKLVLVSEGDMHIITDGKVTGVNYPTDKWIATLGKAVSQLSDFTGDGQFGNTSFTLHQQSSFLKCTVKMDPEDDAPVTSEITAKLFNKTNNTNELLRTAVIKVSEAGIVPFVFAFPGNDVELSDAKIHLEWGDQSEKDFSVSDQLLATNSYYSVSRSTLPYDGFRIRAKFDNTKMKFKFTDGSVQYSENDGETWNTYTGREFTLNTGESICFQGNRADCDCNGTTQLFWADKVCYISGDITSLLSDSDYLAPNAFRSAFSNGNSENTKPSSVTFVDINPDEPLVLPPFTSNNCYREMFRACTSLTSVPALPATVVEQNCYFNMFRSCTGLTTANIELPATEMTENCYREIFRQCTNLTSVPIFKASTLAKGCYRQMLSECTSLGTIVCLATDINFPECLDEWMSKIKSTGTFYQAPGGPFAPGTYGIPSGWTVEDYE